MITILCLVSISIAVLIAPYYSAPLGKAIDIQTMPLEQQHAPMDDDEEVRRMGRGGASSSSRSSVAKSIPKPRPQEWDAGDAGPTSPRVRKRLDDAKENANLFGPGN